MIVRLSDSSLLLVMSVLLAVPRYAISNAARTEPVLHTTFTRRPLPVFQTHLVSLRVTGEVSIDRVIPRDAVSSAAFSKPTTPTNFFSQIITGVVSARVIPWDALHVARITIKVLVAVHL